MNLCHFLIKELNPFWKIDLLQNHHVTGIRISVGNAGKWVHTIFCLNSCLHAYEFTFSSSLHVSVCRFRSQVSISFFNQFHKKIIITSFYA